MSEEQKNPELVEAFSAAMAATACVVCDRAKRVGPPFCESCWYAVPVWARNWLSAGASDVQACETFRIWREHLIAWKDKIRRIGWEFKSWEEIEAAGYKLLNVSRCSATGCGQRIGWIEDSVGHRTPVNVDGDQQFQPHRTTCKNPGVFRERKTVQASARSRRSKRGRR